MKNRHPWSVTDYGLARRSFDPIVALIAVGIALESVGLPIAGIFRIVMMLFALGVLGFSRVARTEKIFVSSMATPQWTQAQCDHLNELESEGANVIDIKMAVSKIWLYDGEGDQETPALENTTPNPRAETVSHDIQACMRSFTDMGYTGPTPNALTRLDPVVGELTEIERREIHDACTNIEKSHYDYREAQESGRGDTETFLDIFNEMIRLHGGTIRRIDEAVTQRRTDSSRLRLLIAEQEHPAARDPELEM